VVLNHAISQKERKRERTRKEMKDKRKDHGAVDEPSLE